MNYSRAVRTIRAAKKLSQGEFSEIVGIDQSLISRIESGERKPSIKNLEAISETLSVPFHLIALLASEPSDLKGISENEAQKLSHNLLEVIVSSS